MYQREPDLSGGFSPPYAICQHGSQNPTKLSRMIETIAAAASKCVTEAEAEAEAIKLDFGCHLLCRKQIKAEK